MNFIENVTKFTVTFFEWIKNIIFIIMGIWIAFHWNELWMFDNPTHVLVLLLLAGYVSIFIAITFGMNFMIKTMTDAESRVADATETIIGSTKFTEEVSKEIENLGEIITDIGTVMNNHLKDHMKNKRR